MEKVLKKIQIYLYMEFHIYGIKFLKEKIEYTWVQGDCGYIYVLKNVEKIKTLKDSLTTQSISLEDFSLATDIDAQREINIEQYEIEKLEISLRDALIKKNDETLTGNPLVTYPPRNGDKNVITKIKVLNHRWIIADFYAGTVRGSVLLKYFINEDKTYDFEIINSVLYQI